jgi:UDP-3-O-[3-hydroxymyristoyl] glucosamine N-acyltransferase
MRVRELAEWLGATFEGDGEKELSGAAPLESAGGSELSFIGNRKAMQQADFSAAGCLIVPPDYPNPSRRTVIRAPEPRTAFARAMSRFYPTDGDQAGHTSDGHHRAKTWRSARWPLSAAHQYWQQYAHWISPAALARAARSASAWCWAKAAVLHPNVTIYDNVDIGRGVILHSGCVIGADGFGYVFENDRYHKFPQVGRVEIGDFVEIGANSCVDRAALGVTGDRRRHQAR